ncbi:MAG TPA: type II secretion system F family protein [Candidatus Krumholzibacteria bacterium]|nr:type II secretion system F family protein [Candidatus Krumholzibacteria bacterium]
MATITFLWKGMSPQGEMLSGELEAATKQDAVANLRKKRIVIKSIRAKSKDLKLPGFKKGVSVKDLSVFTRQFSTMVNAGLPLVQCLDILGKQTQHILFKRAIQTVMSDVEGGTTLAEGLGKHKGIWSDLYVNMVDAGEQGGILDVILSRLAVYLEKADALQRKIKSAMTYPTIVMVVAGGATIFMLLFVIPVFAKMFSDFGGVLPAPTRFVMGISSFLRSWWWLLAGMGIAAVVSYKLARKNYKASRAIDAFMLKIPIVGNVLRKGSVARFTRTLGTLVSSGVPILQGLEITARTAGNLVITEAIQETRESISQGETISEPLKKCDVFPPMVVQMIAVGEQTGALDEMLGKISDFYDDEVDTAVEQLTAAIEPIMIVVMGVIVGGMLIAMYLPMFKMASVISGGS